jgi:hypothetical protein
MISSLAPWVGHPLRRQDLDGDKPVQVRVAGLVHDAHAALAELLGNLVMQQPLSDHRGYPELQILFTS